MGQGWGHDPLRGPAGAWEAGGLIRQQGVAGGRPESRWPLPHPGARVSLPPAPAASAASPAAQAGIQPRPFPASLPEIPTTRLGSPAPTQWPPAPSWPPGAIWWGLNSPQTPCCPSAAWEPGCCTLRPPASQAVDPHGTTDRKAPRQARLCPHSRPLVQASSTQQPSSPVPCFLLEVLPDCLSAAGVIRHLDRSLAPAPKPRASQVHSPT